LRDYKHHRHDAQEFIFTHVVALLLLITPGAMLLSTPRLASGEVYTWENADGTLGVVDDVSKVPEKYRSRAKKVGEKAQGEGETGVYFGKPQEQMPKETASQPRRRAAQGAPVTKEEPLITMEEKKKAEDKAAEQRKKDEEEIKRVWEHMKKALVGH
jgi:hypothetical protein